MMLKALVLSFPVLTFSVLSAFADIAVYPAKNQSAEKMDRDKYECYNWAKGQTGFDPQAATAPQAGGQPGKGGPARGAAGGAAMGAITGNARRGAAVGAGMGALRRRSKEKKEAQEQQAGQAAQQGKRDQFYKAQGACLEGRGYSVSY